MTVQYSMFVYVKLKEEECELEEECLLPSLSFTHLQTLQFY